MTKNSWASTYNWELELRICDLLLTLKSYFEIYPTAVSHNRTPKKVNNFEYLYKHIFILEKEALETVSV